MNRFRTLLAQFAHVMKLQGITFDHSHRPFLENPIIRGRDVHDLAVTMPLVVHDPHVHRQHVVIRPPPDLINPRYIRNPHLLQSIHIRRRRTCDRTDTKRCAGWIRCQLISVLGGLAIPWANGSRIGRISALSILMLRATTWPATILTHPIGRRDALPLLAP